jgi:hypothetical protein
MDDLRITFKETYGREQLVAGSTSTTSLALLKC